MSSLAPVGDATSALVAGSPARFTVTLTSSADLVCAFTPDAAFTITSGRDRVWTSADCPVSGVGGPGTTAEPPLSGTARALLVPGGALVPAHGTSVLTLDWPGVRSDGSCTAAAGSLAPGTYVATLALPGAGSLDASFALR